MSKTKGDHKKRGNKKGKSAKFTKKEYNAPLKYKSKVEQTIQDDELEPVNEGHGAKHLYTLVRKALSGNVLDEWIDISSTRATKSYGNFQVDLWRLTDK